MVVNIFFFLVPDPVQNVKCSKVDGYRIRVEFQCPDGNYSEIQVVVNDKSYNCNCTRSNVISGLQPAKGYMVKVVTLGTDESAVTDKFECYTDSTGIKKINQIKINDIKCNIAQIY